MFCSVVLLFKITCGSNVVQKLCVVSKVADITVLILLCDKAHIYIVTRATSAVIPF